LCFRAAAALSLADALFMSRRDAKPFRALGRFTLSLVDALFIGRMAGRETAVVVVFSRRRCTFLGRCSVYVARPDENWFAGYVALVLRLFPVMLPVAAVERR
jgi:hypothetical protein